MQKAPIPENEASRLNSLYTLGLLDTLPEEKYDRISRIAQKLFDVPVVLFNLVDFDRQFFKSRVGMEENTAPRDTSFCGHAIMQDQLFVIEDALNDERFFDNPVVTVKNGVRFYAGRPLKTLAGKNIGTFCLVDSKPRSMTHEEISLLNDLADIVQDQIQNIELSHSIENTASELKISLEMLASEKKIKDRFLSNISHELRTPMHSILSFSDLGSKKEDIEKSKRYFENIKSSANRLMLMIDDLVDLSDLRKGSYEIRKEEHIFFGILEKQIQLQDDKIKQKNINVVLDGDFRSIAFFDQALLSQVIAKLLSNAVKYSHDKSRVTIAWKISGNSFIFSITDQGIGVPKEEYESIFGEFTESTLTQSNSGGKGIGLTICRENIELHNGSIIVESPPADREKGTRFIVSIPLK
jgi:signal transduction histidine kinase